MPTPHAIRILIVEDDPKYSEIAEGLVRPILEAFPDSTVTVVRTAEAALEAVSGMSVAPPDVMILDLVLPPLGMKETLALLDQFEERTAVVILTGHKKELVETFMGTRKTPVVGKDEALLDRGLLTRAIVVAVELYQNRKWKTYRENLSVMKSISHAHVTQ